MYRSVCMLFAIVMMTSLSKDARADVTIDCPLDIAHTQIISPLPEDWWQTPQEGKLLKTWVAEINGGKALICRYAAYGSRVSVMRRPPRDNKDCHPTETGFTCGKRRVFSRVLKRGVLSVKQSWQADIDQSPMGAAAKVRTPNDIWFESITATQRYLKPVNGAKIAIIAGSGKTNKNDCLAVELSRARIPVNDLKAGTQVCARSGNGQYSVLRLRAPAKPGTQGILEFDFTAWK